MVRLNLNEHQQSDIEKILRAQNLYDKLMNEKKEVMKANQGKKQENGAMNLEEVPAEEVVLLTPSDLQPSDFDLVSISQ